MRCFGHHRQVLYGLCRFGLEFDLWHSTVLRDHDLPEKPDQPPKTRPKASPEPKSSLSTEPKRFVSEVPKIWKSFQPQRSGKASTIRSARAEEEQRKTCPRHMSMLHMPMLFHLAFCSQFLPGRTVLLLLLLLLLRSGECG